MKNINKIVFCLLATAALALQAGVYVLADLPENVQTFIRLQQEAMAQKIEMLNAEQKSAYIFEAARFAPHLSLAFVDQKELSVEHTYYAYMHLDLLLSGISKDRKPIDMSSSVENATIAYWPGKFKVKCGDSVKENYANVVLKIEDNAELSALAGEIRAGLENNWSIKQAFPFSSHITLGRIYQADDKPVDTQHLQKLETKVPAAVLGAVIIKDFKLKGHDGSEDVFALKDTFRPRHSLFE